MINWTTGSKKILFLRHRIEIKLASLFLQKKKYEKSLEIIDRLLVEIRKIDDKHLLVEIQILESQIYHELENIAKAKSSLTAAKACADAIYCPPMLQAALDF